MTAGADRDTTATVAGEAETEADPDIARVHLSVHVMRPSAPAATDAFAVALADARSMLDDTGCTYLVQSTNSWSGDDPSVGHQISASILVTLTDLPALPALVERILETTELEISHVEWALTNERELRRQARILAIAEAREAADDYAAAISMRVAQVLSVNDPGTGGGHRGRAMFAMSAGMADGRPEIDLSNREPVKVHGSVVMTFLLEAND